MGGSWLGWRTDVRDLSQGFGHLHARSGFSYGFGVAMPEELVRAATEMGMEALALTDRDGLYGVPTFSAVMTGQRRVVIGVVKPLPLIEERPRPGRSYEIFKRRGNGAVPACHQPTLATDRTLARKWVPRCLSRPPPVS